MKFGKGSTKRIELEKQDSGELYDVMPGYTKTIKRVKAAAFSKGAKQSFVERLTLKNKTPGVASYKIDRGYHLLSPSPTSRKRI